MSEARSSQLALIADQIKACRLCRLHENTLNAVPGYGDVNAEIMFIGEGPGEQEDKQGLPFVGRSGQYLNYLLELIGVNREKVFITNVVKHRPPGNRDPQPDEILACKAFLDHQITLINPLVIATLGRFSMARYFPKAKISAVHGQAKYDETRAYYPLFHPAAALRNPALRWDMEADFKRLPEIIEEVRRRRAGGDGAPVETPPADDVPDGDPPQQLTLF